MKLVIESVMIFFGTLMAAVIVANGEPAGAELAIIKSVIQEATAVESRATSARPAVLAPDAGTRASRGTPFGMN